MDSLLDPPVRSDLGLHLEALVQLDCISYLNILASPSRPTLWRALHPPTRDLPILLELLELEIELRIYFLG